MDAGGGPENVGGESLGDIEADHLAGPLAGESGVVSCCAPEGRVFGAPGGVCAGEEGVGSFGVGGVGDLFQSYEGGPPQY